MKRCPVCGIVGVFYFWDESLCHDCLFWYGELTMAFRAILK